MALLGLGIDVDIDILDAGLKLLVAVFGVPAIFRGCQKLDLRDKEAAPAGQAAALAIPGGLKDEDFSRPSL